MVSIWRSFSFSTIGELMRIHRLLVIATCKELGIAVIAYSYELLLTAIASF